MSFLGVRMKIWKDIIGYEGIYQVSNTGEVRSLDRKIVYSNGKIYFTKGRLLKQKLNRGGYFCVHLRGNKESHPVVHRLVAISFIGNPKNKPTVNHKDGIKTNNNVNNLEWNTHSEQIKHAISTGLYVQPNISLFTKKGEEHPNSKILDKDVLTIKSMRMNKHTLREISEKFNISISQVHRICKNDSRK